MYIDIYLGTSKSQPGLLTGQFQNGKPDGISLQVIGTTTFFGEWKRGQRSGFGIESNTATDVIKVGDWSSQGDIQTFSLNQIEANAETANSKYGNIALNKEFIDILWSQSLSGRYTGQTSSEDRHGLGYIKYSDGRAYYGVWKRNERTGFGIFVWTNNDIYAGFFLKGLRHGLGYYLWADGSTYQGRYEYDQRSGEGTLRYSNGKVYTGSWKLGKWHGQGHVKFGNGRWEGDEFVGEWRNGEKNGFGKYNHSEGEYFEGTYVDDEPSNGFYIFKDGSTYKGDFKNNQMDGFGRRMWATGSRTGDEYEGQWMNSYATGKGTYFYANGSVYTGDMMNAKRHGNGTMVYKPNLKYSGQWILDDRQGYGVMTYSDGSEYKGDWDEDQNHGYGQFTFKDGSFYFGEWNHGILEDQYPSIPSNNDQSVNGNQNYDGYAEVEFYDGLYSGNFQNGMRHGSGNMTYKDGSIYNGTWKNDVKSGNGWLFYNNGTIYLGDFENDKMNGVGSLFYSNKLAFHGLMENSKIVKGLIFLSESDVYFGLFRDNLPHGDGYSINLRTKSHKCSLWQRGLEISVYDSCNQVPELVEELYFDNNNYYRGDVKKQGQFQLKHGHGEWKFDDRYSYVGGWSEDEMDGFGVLQDDLGPTFVGQFRKGQRHGSGILLAFSDEYRYAQFGGWKYDKFTGAGQFAYPDNSRVIGMFRDESLTEEAVFEYPDGLREKWSPFSSYNETEYRDYDDDDDDDYDF